MKGIKEQTWEERGAETHGDSPGPALPDARGPACLLRLNPISKLAFVSLNYGRAASHPSFSFFFLSWEVGQKIEKELKHHDVPKM